MRKELFKFISYGLLSVSLTVASSFAQTTGSGPHLDRVEVQKFEQNYESWIQSIIHQVLPKATVSILTEFNYSNNPDLIQNFEERRAVAHLPGLPDVSDMNDSHPTENPIYDLITQQNIKIIFEQQPSDDQMRIIQEILAVKLNLDSTHGDRISFDYLQGSNKIGKAVFGKNGRAALGVVVLSAIAAGLLLARRNRKSFQLKELGEKEVNNLYLKLNPLSAILTTETKLLISVIRKQETDFLVQVMAHAPVAFNQIILQIFDQEERQELFDAFQSDRLNVSRKKSKYSQLLLAAKIHDELKIEAIQQVDVYNEITARINEHRVNMQESLKQLKALYEPNETVQAVTEEVSYEETL